MAQTRLIENCWKVLRQAQKLSIEVPWGFVRGIEFGPKDADPVLMVHGWLDNCHSYLPLLTHLPLDSKRFIVLDLPGHGQSSHKPKTSYVHVIDYVVDMEHIRRKLKLEQFSLVGHSLGGILSGMYTATYPDRVKRCVAIDGLLPFYQPNDYIVSNMRKAIDTIVDDTFEHKLYKNLDTLNNRLSAHYKIEPGLSSLLLDRSTRYSPEGYQFTYDKRLRYPALIRMTKEILFPITDLWKRPILYVLATDGFKILNHPSYEEGIEQLRNNPFVSILEIPGTHHVHVHNPEEVGDAIISFLEMNKEPDPMERLPYNFKGI